MTEQSRRELALYERVDPKYERIVIFSRSDRSLSVTLLVLPGSSVMCTAATLDPMRAANRVCGRSCYRWSVVSATGEAPVSSCGLPIPVSSAFDPSEETDALFVIGGFDALKLATRPLLRGVRKVASAGSTIGGIEAGAWVLARAGLLKGRGATTHWEDLEEFKMSFPDVDVRPDRYVIDGPVFTTGGATPALDFMLELIRARQGETVALDVASIFIYEGARMGSDRQHFVALGRISQQDPKVTKAVRLMEGHIERPLRIPVIARRIGVSTRSLEMAFRRSLDVSPAVYYLGLRLNAARRLIVDNHLTVADSAARSGFSSASSLSRAFSRHFGRPPREMVHPRG